MVSSSEHDLLSWFSLGFTHWSVCLHGTWVDDGDIGVIDIMNLWKSMDNGWVKFHVEGGKGLKMGP